MSTHDEDITREFWGDSSPRRSHSRRSQPRRSGSASTPRRRLSEGIDPNFSRNLVVVGLALFALGGLSAFAVGSDEEPEPTPASPAVETTGVAVSTSETTVTTVPGTSAPTPTAPESSTPDTTTSATTVPETTTTDSTAAPATSSQAEPSSRSAADACALRYEVRPGDYWIRIADGAGISLGQVLAANSATTDSVLLPGDRVCLPAGASMPSPPPTTTAAPTTTAPPRPASPAPATAPSTAPSTTAPTTTAPRPTGSNESREQVQAIIREIFPEDQHEMALRVAQRESNYRPGVYNGHCCYGVFQIHWTAHRSWLRTHGVTESAHLLDARTNIQMAWVLYQRSGGWGPWSQTAY